MDKELESLGDPEMLGDAYEVVRDAGRISGDHQYDQRLEFHIVVFSPVALDFEHDEQNQLKYQGRDPKGYAQERLVSHITNFFLQTDSLWMIKRKKMRECRQIPFRLWMTDAPKRGRNRHRHFTINRPARPHDFCVAARGEYG